MVSITTASQWLLLGILVINQQSVFIHSFQQKRVFIQVSNPHKFIAGSLSKRFATTTTTESSTTDVDINVFASTTAELLITNTTDIVVVDQHPPPQQQGGGGGGGTVEIKTQASAFDYGILLICPMLWGKLVVLFASLSLVAICSMT